MIGQWRGAWISRIFVHVKLVAVLLAGVGLMSCASTSKDVAPLTFPAEAAAPYLTLEQIIEGEVGTDKGLFARLGRLITGPRAAYAISQPSDMTVDAQDRLLIVDAELGLILIFIRPEGTWVFDKELKIPGATQPQGIAASAEHVYVSDIHTKAIYMMNSEDELVGTITDPGFKRPGDLSIDAQNQRLMVADPPAHQVFVFDLSGEKLEQVGVHDSGLSQLMGPVSSTVSSDGNNLFILDGIARQVKHFGPDHAFISSFGKYDQVPGSFAFPKGIAQASDGVLFVSDAAFGNIQMFDPSGALLYFFGENGTQAGQFLLPRSLFMDKDQRLYVADPYNSRVQIFHYDAQQ